VVAIAGANAVGYALVLFATLRAGSCAALLPATVDGEAIAAMLADSGARVLFLDRAMSGKLAEAALPLGVPLVPYQGVPSRIAEWMAGPGSRPQAIEIQPEDPCVILYSCGTLDGSIHSHGLRMSRLRLGAASGLAPDPVKIAPSEPLHSDAALVDFLGAVAKGARIELIAELDTGA
jgi:acyl-CoA synthetase (AMP-forming)/AMP-acid ligase II